MINVSSAKGSVHTRTLRIADLNPSLLCTLCSGYLIDATTIIECLHSFCRSCIVKYLETHKYCPICEVQVHKTKPLLNIRPDETLQDIVYKLVPGLFQNEMRRRREFHSRRSVEEVSTEMDDSPICLSLEYDDKNSKHLCRQRRFLRCPRAVRIHHLHKLLRSKYALDEKHHKIDVMCAGESLRPDLTIGEMARIYLWRTKSPLHLTYKIFTAIAKNNTQVKEKEEITKTDEKKDEMWKEVQLQISENGVMSVTGINENETNNKNQSNSLKTSSELNPETRCSSPKLNTTVPTAADLLNNNDVTSKIVEEVITSKPVEKTNKVLTEKVADDKNTLTVDQESVGKVENVSTEKEKKAKIVTMEKKKEAPTETSNEGGPTEAKRPKCEKEVEGPKNIEEVKQEKTRQNEGSKVEKVEASKSEKVIIENNASKSSLEQNQKNVENLSSGHPLKVHAQSRSNQVTPMPPPGIQYSRVGIVPKKTVAPNYKTLRDPPKAWNPQLPPPQQQIKNDSSKPAKFFKARNNMPRFLGNPASGVKPMYQVPPENGERPSTPRPITGTPSVTRIDPKTLRPITSTNNQSQLKINQSTVPILNPLRDKDKRSMPPTKPPHANGRRKNLSPPNNNNQLMHRPNLNFTPPNPFIPNLSPNLTPAHFLYPHLPTPPPLPSPLFYTPSRYGASIRSPRAAPPTSPRSNIPESTDVRGSSSGSDNNMSSKATTTTSKDDKIKMAAT